MLTKWQVHQACLGVVLAGGLSSRMGQDKAQLLRKNMSMVDFSKQLLLDAGLSQVIVSGNGYDVSDNLVNAGPLGGIFSVLQQTRASALLVLPVDLPLMSPVAIKQLIHQGQLSQKASFYGQDYLPLYLPVNGYLELYLTKALSDFSVKGGKGPSMRSLIAAMPHQVLTPDSQGLLFNANTPQQWQQAKIVFNRV